MTENLLSFLEEKHLIEILNNIHDGVIVINKDRKIVFINETGRRLLKYEEGEVLNSKCKSITKTSKCDIDCPLTYAISINENLKDIEMIYTTKNGNHLICKTNVILLKDEKGNLLGGVEVFKDVTKISTIQKELEEKFDFSNIIGRSSQIQEVFEQIKMVANTDSTCLITGESGTGKELIANAIHYNSKRKDKPYIKVNCAVFNEGIFESELFGHVKGAFTGAIWDKIGRFEAADQGTIFLDEVTEIPPSIQVKLLRVLQEGEFERVGSSKTIKVNVRIIAASNKDVEEEVKNGNLRSDLYYRLNVFRIKVPPLRERKDDIPLLVSHFIEKISKKMPYKHLKGIEAEALIKLLNYDYPGNVRELENIIENAAIRAKGEYIKETDLPININKPSLNIEKPLNHILEPLQSLEKEIILKTLEETKWKITKTAKKLGVSRVTLWRKMKDYGIRIEK